MARVGAFERLAIAGCRTMFPLFRFLNLLEVRFSDAIRRP